MSELVYHCPLCSGEVGVPAELVGKSVVCPHCQGEFLATAPEQALSTSAEPDRLPFFSFSRRRMLKKELEQLVADGEYSAEDHNALVTKAAALKLSEADLNDLRQKMLEEEFKPIRARLYETVQLTDGDVERLSALERKFKVKIDLGPEGVICRNIFLMEERGENPLIPIQSETLMLDSGEVLYFSIDSGWAQLRSKTTGYTGFSLSIPTGVKGMRFRVGQLSPIRTEQLTSLGAGVLHVTSKRLFFDGQSRNTTITFGRIVGTSLFSDALAIEKSTGATDYFSMGTLHGRYVAAIIRVLKLA